MKQVPPTPRKRASATKNAKRRGEAPRSRPVEKQSAAARKQNDTDRVHDRVRQRLLWQQAINDPEREPRNRSPRLAELRRWQMQRLAASFAPLLEESNTRAAAEFFLSDLYGDRDFSGRDRDVARVLPLMLRLLPEPLIATVADAIGLSVLSHAFDLRMAQALEDLLSGRKKITADSYGMAYRQVGLPQLRGVQIDLIARLAHGLDAAVRKPALGRLLRMSRLPAWAAGLGELQSFLERGFAAFAALDQPALFVDRVVKQEREIAQRLFADAAKPFGQPSKSGKPL
ncbi:MAG: hypothetical protein ABIQ97_01845 [Lysobacteraceae bacterium]